MDKKNNYLSLEKFSKSCGADLFGVAGIGQVKNEFVLSKELLEKLDFGVSLGVSLSQAVLEEIRDAPTRLYFHHYRALNMFLDQLAIRVTNYIQKKGFLSLPIPASQIVNWEKQTAHLAHKKIGVLAGLGWIGRNNLLVNNTLGSQFRLVTILTNLPLKTDKPIKEGCGSCRFCVEACPAGAITEDSASFDHHVCFEKLKDFQKQRLVEQYICGVCVNACKRKNEPSLTAGH